MGTLREGGTKNPTLFGSTGEERWKFFRAGTKNLGASSAATANASFATSQQSPAPLGAAFLVSPSAGASASGSTSAAGSGTGAREGGQAPHVSVTAPTPSTSPRGSRMGNMSYSDATSSNLNPNDSGKSHGKRKIVDSEEEKPVDEHLTRPISILGRTRDCGFFSGQ